jgi:hypothetical protein
MIKDDLPGVRDTFGKNPVLSKDPTIDDEHPAAEWLERCRPWPPPQVKLTDCPIWARAKFDQRPGLSRAGTGHRVTSCASEVCLFWVCAGMALAFVLLAGLLRGWNDLAFPFWNLQPRAGYRHRDSKRWG